MILDSLLGNFMHFSNNVDRQLWVFFQLQFYLICMWIKHIEYKFRFGYYKSINNTDMS